MAGRRRDFFRAVLEVLTLEEVEYLAKLSDTERRRKLEALLDMREINPEIFSICRKESRGEPLSEEELRKLVEDFDTYSCRGYCAREGLEWSDIYIGEKLKNAQLDVLIGEAHENPSWYEEEFRRIAAPPPVPPPVPPPAPPVAPPVRELPPKEALEKALEAVKKRWRGPLPFKTGDFIKEFLLSREERGAYPYEVWRAMKRALAGMIVSSELVEVFKKAGGISIDGLIDEKLVRSVPESMRYPAKHVCLYDSFRRYFHLLKNLGLIHKVRKEKSPEWDGLDITRVYYAISMEKKNSRLWDAPQEFAYPLSFLGKRRWDELLELVDEIRRGGMERLESYIAENRETLEEYEILSYFDRLTTPEEFTIKHAYAAEYIEHFVKVANTREISYSNLMKMILEGRYFLE